MKSLVCACAAVWLAVCLVNVEAATTRSTASTPPPDANATVSTTAAATASTDPTNSTTARTTVTGSTAPATTPTPTSPPVVGSLDCYDCSGANCWAFKWNPSNSDKKSNCYSCYKWREAHDYHNIRSGFNTLQAEKDYLNQFGLTSLSGCRNVTRTTTPHLVEELCVCKGQLCNSAPGLYSSLLGANLVVILVGYLIGHSY